jgi:hypothetical protein
VDEWERREGETLLRMTFVGEEKTREEVKSSTVDREGKKGTAVGIVRTWAEACRAPTKRNPRPTLKKLGWDTREEQRLYHRGHGGTAEITEKKVEKETQDPPSQNEDGAPGGSVAPTVLGGVCLAVRW